jgi:hypothetical protein
MLPEVHFRDGIHEMEFLNLGARFEADVDAYPHDPLIRPAIDHVQETLIRLQRTAADAIPKIQFVRLLKVPST